MSNQRLTDPDAIARALAEPFPPDRLGWKPQSVSGNRALAIAYIDARDVMDRLDAVVGMGNWTDEFEMLPDGSVLCGLRLRLGGEWIMKQDVGGESDQKDAGDRHKAAVSDALKRAAVKFGVGRYLYSLPAQWCDYDPQKKQLLKTPTLPAWALPASEVRGQRSEVGSPPPTSDRRPPTSEEPCVNDQERKAIGNRIREVAEKVACKARPLAERLLAHLGVKGVGQIPAGRYQDALAWLADQQPVQNGAEVRSRMSEVGSQIPTSDIRPPTSVPNVNLVAYLLRIDSRLRAVERTWTKALAYCHIDTPEGWEEPESEKDLEGLAGWLTREQAARVEAALTPAVRKGA